VDNYDALWRQMSILKSEGVNAFRTSHNPPSPEMIDVCQRLGIVMMVEAFDAWHNQKLSQDYHLYFDQWSDYDISEMVDEAKNSPAVMMWSIGNEIPSWGASNAPANERRLVGDIKAIDTTRPVVAGSDRYRSLPSVGSIADQMVLGLDGLGLNYNPAQVVDQLHARYPNQFFFESESSSETSTRGYYQDPDQVNTGPNQTPGKHEVSSYDNNLASWTMSDEYGLKKDRDRQYFAGQFIWSGFDYIGEPTPYSVFPVKASFFGTIDTAGFPKDAYYLFQSQWTPKPMVHITPMNWTDYKPGEYVQVWTYSNAPTVELFLNGVSLGAKSFDSKTSTEGVKYLETTECSNDDKTYTGGACPGSYQSPNGSSGKLHLTWNVPFAPGKLVAVARDADGKQVARDELDTAGAATSAPTPWRRRSRPPPRTTARWRSSRR
jgi:beta-galactosidase